MIRYTYKFVSLISVIAVLICSLSASITAEAPQDDKTTVIAGSDFQAADAVAGRANIEGILGTIRANGISSADGLLFCGDYDKNTVGDINRNTAGIAQIKSAFSNIVPSDNMIFVQGNHDCEIGQAGMSPSGNNDPVSGAYGVFVINEDDYMWFNDDEARIRQTAQELNEYLTHKHEEKYSRPIFVVSHLPLHFSMRTFNDGDGKYAKYIFDVLNNAGKKGLNIVFLFGHDHSNGWDDYLGGAAIYLAKGDSIIVADKSRYRLANETLDFTYLNAGYVGYYANHNGVDSTLTMTVFTFDDEDMQITRYDADGIHNMKAAGVTNAYKNETLYPPNTRVYTSPQTIKLNVFETVGTDTDVNNSTQWDSVDTETSMSVSTDNSEKDSGSNCGSIVGGNLPIYIVAIMIPLAIKLRKKE